MLSPDCDRGKSLSSKSLWTGLLQCCGVGRRSKDAQHRQEGRRNESPELPFRSVTFHRGQYYLLRAIGSGTYGDVYLARHPATRDCVAVKRHIRAGDGFKDFEASLRLSRVLPDHPLIVQLLDHVIQDGERLTVMELCPCGDLQGLMVRLHQHEACSEFEAAFFILEVAEALGHLHERGVWHLDVRPSNILLSRTGHCRLADFSICEVGEARQEPQFLTFSVRLSSRGRWLPPEILPNRSSPGGGFTDWFSLGALAEALTAGAPGLSAEFRHFVARLMERDRTARLGSQRGIAEVLSHGFIAHRVVGALRVQLGAAAGGSVAALRQLVRSERLEPPVRVMKELGD